MVLVALRKTRAQGGDPERVRLLDRLEAVERAYRARCADLVTAPEEEAARPAIFRSCAHRFTAG